MSPLLNRPVPCSRCFQLLEPFRLHTNTSPVVGRDREATGLGRPNCKCTSTCHSTTPKPDSRLQLSSKGHRILAPGVQLRTIDDINYECKDCAWPEISRYGLSKLAVVLWTKKLQRQFDAEGVPITAISVHPGEVDTGKPLRLHRSTLFISSSQRVPRRWECHGSYDSFTVSSSYRWHSLQSIKVPTQVCSQPPERR